MCEKSEEAYKAYAKQAHFYARKKRKQEIRDFAWERFCDILSFVGIVWIIAVIWILIELANIR